MMSQQQQQQKMPPHTHSKNETVINKAAAGYVYSFEVR
jgi:hypothetical protein